MLTKCSQYTKNTCSLLSIEHLSSEMCLTVILKWIPLSINFTFHNMTKYECKQTCYKAEFS